MRHYIYEDKDSFGYPLGTYSGHIRHPSTDYLIYGTKSYNCRTAAMLKIAIVLSRMKKNG